MGGKVDLHLHTTYSDGAYSAEDLIALAHAAGITALSITDHDHVGALDAAAAAARRFGIDVIPGVELSTTIDDLDIHVLGYYVDPHNADLREHLEIFRHHRRKRAERIVEKLNGLRVPLVLDDVLAEAGTASVGRPHIALALLRQGFTGTYHEAFTRYIGDGKPAYEHKYRITPREAFALIAGAGGLSFVAHPGNTVPDDALRELINDGVDGIEVVHPSHTAPRTAYYRAIANEYFLLTSGGSDFHGGQRTDRELLGRYTVTPDHVTAMRRRLR